MAIYSPILRWFGLGSLSNKDTGPQLGSSGSLSSDAGINVNDERAMAVSSVWACANIITNSVCSLPINFFSKVEEGREPVEDDHYLNVIFKKQPNRTMKPRDMRKAMTLQMVLWNNAYAEIIWNGTRPVALMPLRPGRMTPTIAEDGSLFYDYQTDKGNVVYSARRIFHLKGVSTEGIVGLDRNTYAKNTMGLSVSADVYASKQFAHGGSAKGGGYLKFDDWLTKQQREQAKELYSGISATAYEAGKLWLLEGGVSFERDSVPPDTMQMLQTRQWQVGEIARFYGVPEVLLGSSNQTASWPASFEQQLQAFLTFTLQDYIDEWESEIGHSLVLRKNRPEIFADHDVTNFIKMDSTAKANLHASWVQNGLKTRNEIRKINNDPPVDGADELTVQVNLTPIDELPGATNATQTAQPLRSVPA